MLDPRVLGGIRVQLISTGSHHFVRFIAEPHLGSRVILGDQALGIGGHDHVQRTIDQASRELAGTA